ncbi:hypothetical protein EMIT053CA3_60080 [Pseudomonas donghuensis]
MKAVDQTDAAGERDPLQPAHGQQVGYGDDAQACAAGVRSGQVADFDNCPALYRLRLSGADHALDRLVQVTLEKQRLGACQAYTGHGTKRSCHAAERKQFGHEVADLRAMDFAKALLDEGFKQWARAFAGERPGQHHGCRVRSTEAQGQGNIPVKVRHGSMPPTISNGRSIRGNS